MKKFAAYNSMFVLILAVAALIVFYCSGMAVKKLSKNEAIKRFRIIYANYSNALLKTSAQMGTDIGCYYSTSGDNAHDFTGCDEFYKTFVSNLNVQKYCHGNALADSCIPVYQDYTTRDNCIGFSQEMMNVHDDVFVMPDGSNVIVFNVRKNDRRPIFAVDINGFASPNKAGEDLFSMTLMRNQSGAYYFHSNISYCLPVEKDAIEYVNDVYK